MAKINKIAKNVNEVGKVVGAVAGVVMVATPLLEMAGEVLSEKIEERKSLIEIPQVIFSDGYISLEEATKYIEEAGLKAGKAVAKENISFKDCSEFDVVDRSYKRRKRVPPGTRIILYYVTNKVIDKSNQLFEDSEKEKAEIERKKAERLTEKTEKRRVQAEKNKQKIDAVVSNVQRGLIDSATNVKKTVGKIISKHDKHDA